jgi:predicted Na+-dependent transporter
LIWVNAKVRASATVAADRSLKDTGVGQLHSFAAAALPVCIIAFMVGNLAAIGLELEFRAALAPLHNLRFVIVVMALDWVLGPAFAWALARVVPMAEPYALGLDLIGLAPAAPFLPMMVRRAGGDLAYAACFMLVAAVGTVIFMPIALPILEPGLAVSAWTVARPLILLLLVPLLIGLLVKASMPAVAGRLYRVVKRLADLATLAMLAAIVVLYWRGFVGAIGSYAIATQLLYAIGATVGSYLLSAGLKPEQRSVVSLGACTRNLGAALAPLQALDPDPRTIVMIALGVPITLIVTGFAARWFEKRPTGPQRA